MQTSGRLLAFVDLGIFPPTELPSSQRFYADYPSQSLDTRITGGLGTVLDEVGEHRFTFQSTAYANACTATGTSNVVSKTINALQCGPQFKENGTHDPLHVPATSIEFYVPPDFYSIWDPAINTGPLRQVVDEWNAGVNGTGVELFLTSTPCSGVTCIALAEGTMAKPTQCAQTEQPNLPNLGLTNTTTIRLTTGVPSVTAAWGAWDVTALRRTLAHEIGHALGMDHPEHGTNCMTPLDGVMLDEVLPTCDGSTSGVHVTINDTLPDVKTVFGGKPQVKCGFPTVP
jgi:hypothetical protein